MRPADIDAVSLVGTQRSFGWWREEDLKTDALLFSDLFAGRARDGEAETRRNDNEQPPVPGGAGAHLREPDEGRRRRTGRAAAAALRHDGPRRPALPDLQHVQK